ncbi:alkaline phosphatase family protein [Pedococcus sp. 5OH_020]|uniref:alkaline phosphatase family protein n=1 Tax=Pedococcus sp. 5OH_020 TaxID=2989814 RepID=UPI0022E9CF7C|nr:alkaline phosphatase family protein [Pedococcus sp. 5OH_020]
MSRQVERPLAALTVAALAMLSACAPGRGSGAQAPSAAASAGTVSRQPAVTAGTGPPRAAAPTAGTRSTSVASGSTRGGSSGSPSVAPRRVDKLLVVVVENHSLGQMRRQMPYTYGLAQQYGYADHYTAIRHPSLPNYLAIASGSTHGVRDDDAPAAHLLSGASVFGAAVAAGRTAGVYVDAMSSPCQSASSGRYAVKHNPWPYFTAERALCDRDDLPLSVLERTVREGALPSAGMIVPDLCHDAHDCSLLVADTWFRTVMERVMAGPDWRSGRLAVVLTADEDDRTAGNRVLTVVAHPSLRHVVVAQPLTHYSLTRLYAEVTGTSPLGRGAQAPSMAQAFGLPLR